MYKKHIKNYSLVLIGTVAYCLGINLFIVPANLYNGGVMGIAQLLRTFFIQSLKLNIPASADLSGIIFFILNIPIMIIAYKDISRSFFVKTIVAVVVQTILLSAIPIPSEAIVSDITAASVTGAILCGFGTGITLLAGGSCGGTDTLGIFFAKRYRTLLGYTFGTGFGFGFVTNGELHTGDNSCIETFCLRHKHMPNIMVEDGVAVRAVKRVYKEESGIDDPSLQPKDIFDIAEGTREGNRAAAIGSFAEFGRATGDAFASVASLLDGLIVVGGGLTGARKYIMPSVMAEMRSTLSQLAEGERTDRMPVAVYELDDEVQFERFARGQQRELKVYGSDRTVSYDPEKRIGIIFSKLGASRAVSLGAYAFALNELDSRK